MPTRNISLTDHFDQLIDNAVESGEYQNASEVVRAGLRLLEERRRTYETKLAALRAAARVGFDELDRGEGVRIDLNAIGEFIDSLDEQVDQLLVAKA